MSDAIEQMSNIIRDLAQEVEIDPISTLELFSPNNIYSLDREAKLQSLRHVIQRIQNESDKLHNSDYLLQVLKFSVNNSSMSEYEMAEFNNLMRSTTITDQKVIGQTDEERLLMVKSIIMQFSIDHDESLEYDILRRW